MNDIIVEGEKIIAFGDVSGIEILPSQTKYQYLKAWPKDTNGKKLPKGLCKWAQIKYEVEAKTPEELDIEQVEKDKQEEYDIITQKLPELLQDAKTKGLTFEQFLDTI